MEFNVEDILKELVEGKIDNPVILSEYVTRLSAFLWTAGQQILDAEVQHAKQWRVTRTNCKSDHECDLLMKDHPAWRTHQDARLAEKTINKAISAIKCRIRCLGNEWKNAYG